jgi:transcription antitermination protein NusB
VKKDWRRRGREAALQILYQWDLGRADIEVTIETFFDLQWPDRQPPPAALRAFAAALARDTVAELGEIDGLIAEAAENWRPERMAVLDRLVLRMAVCELLRHSADTPPPVVINEAIELARTFSTEEAVKFINGMLDGIKRKIVK